MIALRAELNGINADITAALELVSGVSAKVGGVDKLIRGVEMLKELGSL